MKKMIISTIFMAMIFSMASFGMNDQNEQIEDFVYKKDIKQVLKIIENDWNWLYPSNRPDYDPEYILQSEIPNKNLLSEKKLKMKVLRINERIIGFVTFYKENSETCWIRLVSIAQNFRKKGYGKKLTIAALNDLFDLGCTNAYLWTNKKNEKVPTYESLGFQEGEMSQDDILWFEENGISAKEYVQYAQYSLSKKTFESCIE